MYFKNIFNIETEKIARLKKVERVDRLGELDSKYWTVEKHDDGNLIRAFPRFNMDNLSSDNTDDIIINPEVLIAHNLMNTIISCDSSNVNLWDENELTVKLYFQSWINWLSSNPTILFNVIVTDNQNNLVNGVSVDLYFQQPYEETVVYLGEAVTDKNGYGSLEYTPEFTKQNMAGAVWCQLKNNDSKLCKSTLIIINDLGE